MNIAEHIRTIPDFPKPGILFYDISTLLAYPPAWRHTVDLLAGAIRKHEPDVIAGIESRGFLVGAPVALELGCSFIMLRKEGKLPGETASYTYDLEYGSDTVEMQVDAIASGQKVVIIDDLLATGGTAGGALHLLRQAEADVRAAAFIIELNGLGGREHLDAPVTALVEFDA
ncbi:MAG: adenine phosphoribosyltransferase [Alphaproteobacteria bacterium]|nr:adenine phosphoribosyltransferase [Alphaproteobacteria bacterium]HCP00260.1 adenine phosphoribosyltransferase [Rhodospirillaceae bacterium]